MNQHDDGFGLKFTAARPESAQDFKRFTSSYMGFRRETGKILNEITTADEKMPMALCAKGYFAKMFGSSNQSARANLILQDLRNTIDLVGANERESQHAAALTAWCKGDLNRATDAWENILLDHPNDGLALRLAHFTHFYSGDPRRMRDSAARILPLWSSDHPDYGFLLGMYAFGLEESGDFVKAESYGRRAVERNPADAWSVHSVAHVLEMTERQEEGIAWVSGLEKDWSTVNNFRFHLYWHRSLYHLERGEFSTVLEIYDKHIVSDIASDFYLDICNASSLLWRLEMFGIDVGDRWTALVEVARNHVQDKDLIFVSLHYLMALVAGGDQTAAEQMIETIQKWSTLGDTQAKVCADCGLALAKGLRMAREGKHAQAVAIMAPARYAMDAIGGSIAQRDVFYMIMLEAARLSEDSLKARSLFNERLGNKMHSSWTWKSYGDVLLSLGNETEGQEALAKARSLLTTT